MQRIPGSYRLNVANIRAELDRLRGEPIPPKGRMYIKDSKDTSRLPVPSESLAHAVKLYGAMRVESVLRVMTVFEVAREVERLDRREKKVLPTRHRAVWQSSVGTRENHACHLVPAHLQLDGQLPTLITQNAGIQRHLINEFAACLVMPRSINYVDRLVDVAAGQQAFEKAAQDVLNQRGATAKEGLDAFLGSYGELFGHDRALSFEFSGGLYLPDSERDALVVETVSGFYEGVFLTRIDMKSAVNFKKQVETEVQLASTSNESAADKGRGGT